MSTLPLFVGEADQVRSRRAEGIRIDTPHGAPIEVARTVSRDGSLGIIVQRDGVRLVLTVATAVAVAAALSATAEGIRAPSPPEAP